MGWLPVIPDRFAARIACFTEHRDGFVRKYRGDTRSVMGAKGFLKIVDAQGWTIAVQALEDRWKQKKNEIDAATSDTIAAFRISTGRTIEQLASEFFAWLDKRWETGKPKRIEEVTVWDYRRTINELLAVVGPDITVNDFGPGHFSQYAKVISANAHTSYRRKVAYVEAFVRWSMRQGLMANNEHLRNVRPGMDSFRSLIGPDLMKPPESDMRDSRIEKEQAFTPAEIGKLWAVADDMERLWILLGLVCAFDNSDTMRLTGSVIVPADETKGIPKARRGQKAPRLVIDYRRRKRGRIRRVIPLPDRLSDLIEQFASPGDGLFFTHRDGTPLFKMSESGPQNYLTRRFVKLMVRAGLRDAPQIIRVDGKKRVLSKGTGDGRGYRSLRTTFPNLSPTGYRDEIEIVMGHAHGEVLLDRYLETHGFTRLFSLTTSVLKLGLSEPPDEEWLAAHPKARPA